VRGRVAVLLALVVPAGDDFSRVDLCDDRDGDVVVFPPRASSSATPISSSS
jgi:hypothetical protein